MNGNNRVTMKQQMMKEVADKRVPNCGPLKNCWSGRDDRWRWAGGSLEMTGEDAVVRASMEIYSEDEHYPLVKLARLFDHLIRSLEVFMRSDRMAN